MAIWRSLSNSAPTGDPEIHVKYTGLSLSSTRKTEATEAVTRARFMVVYVVAKLSSLASANASDAVKKHAAYYFKRGATLTQPELDTIKSVLVQIQTGLTSDMNVKVTKDDGSMGYVNPHYKGDKDRWSAGKKGFDGDGNALSKVYDVKRGDIHIDTKRLDTGIKLSAKTVIHEASHKFASTADFGERGYTHDGDGTFRADGLTADQALNNAESYARFVLHVFDDECKW